MHNYAIYHFYIIPIIPRAEMEVGSRGSPCTETLLGGTDLHHHSNLTLCSV